MNFLGCDGDWLVNEAGNPVCNGQLVAFTEQEMAGQTSGLTWDDVSQLQGEVLILFAGVFGFLVLRKALK